MNNTNDTFDEKAKRACDALREFADALEPTNPYRAMFLRSIEKSLWEIRHPEPDSDTFKLPVSQSMVTEYRSDLSVVSQIRSPYGSLVFAGHDPWREK